MTAVPVPAAVLVFIVLSVEFLPARAGGHPWL